MSGSLSNINLLIVDDSMYMRRLLMTMLRGMGARHLQEAKSGNEALDMLYKKPADIVIVDWMMDGLNGLDFVKVLRQSPREDLLYMPVIMMTGHTERENIEAARDVGVTEFLAKPFTANGLFARLEIMVDKPRPFVKTRNYFGPDRRRRDLDPPFGERRLVNPRRVQ